MCLQVIEIVLVVELGEVLDPDEGKSVFGEVVGVLDLVQISVHVAVEMTFDVTLHDRLGVDEDAVEHFAAKAFAYRSSVDETCA